MVHECIGNLYKVSIMSGVMLSIPLVNWIRKLIFDTTTSNPYPMSLLISQSMSEIPCVMDRLKNLSKNSSLNIVWISLLFPILQSSFTLMTMMSEMIFEFVASMKVLNNENVFSTLSGTDMMCIFNFNVLLADNRIFP